MELDIEKLKQDTEVTLKRNKAILIFLFLIGSFGFFCIYSYAPQLSPSDQKIVYKLPSTPLQLFHLSQVIQKYAALNYWYVIFAISYLYVLLQSFCIPGPPILNILAGTMFGFYQSFALVTICSTLGSVLCYLIFETIGKGIAIRLFPGKILLMHKKLNENRDRLFFYLLSIRVTPFVPKWLASISSPIVGVPLKTFALTAMLGLIPHNFIHINAGIAIKTMKDFGMTLDNILVLGGLGLLSFLPTLVIKKVKED